MARAGAQSIVAAAAVHEIEPRASLLAVAERLARRFAPFWLDSALEGGALGRFSYAGAEPFAIARARRFGLEIECLRAARPDLAPGRLRVHGEPLELLARLLGPAPLADPAPDLPFVGGAVGWLGYELAERLEPTLSLRAEGGLGLPDLCFLLVDRAVALDHANGRRFACALGFGASEGEARERAEAGAAAWAAEVLRLETDPPPPRARASAPSPARASASARAVPSRSSPRSRLPPPAASSLDEASYAKAVAYAKARIEAGDLYQACLTRRIELPFAGDPWRLYLALRARNPAPFAAWLSLPEVAVLSCSPERFLALDAQRRVESRPIKGTRPRGADPARDAALARELAASEKDRAENLMIVDLVRNDLGRVCAPGSVHVPELRAVESYATVHQMVSTVRGRLRASATVFDLVRAAFPPGSMTGAPKLAAIELLARLEPVPRGIYGGALGYLDARGGAGLSVVIRTALLRGGRAYVHAGGGIVADSDPAAEWRESEDKARALVEAIAEVS